LVARKSINFEGYGHANPIPNASLVGNILMSSIISGRAADGSGMPEDLSAQIANIFVHIGNAVRAAGGTPENIVKVNFWMHDPATGRAALNGEWERMFPDPASRPARHTLALSGDGPAKVTCDFMAVMGQ
jgi:2-iminobutanoate/2-iminopropanoate deaminase